MNMPQLIKEKPQHWPTLNTVIMVERTLKKMEGSVMSVADLKRKLPRQVNHNTLTIHQKRDRIIFLVKNFLGLRLASLRSLFFDEWFALVDSTSLQKATSSILQLLAKLAGKIGK